MIKTKTSIKTLNDLLIKVTLDQYSDYYSKKGYSVFRDGLILLRTTFHEPFIKENFKYKHFQIYKDFHLIKYNNLEENKSLTIEKVPIFEKLLILTFNERITDNTIINNSPIIYFHNSLLNDAVHNNIIITAENFINCYYVIQNFSLPFFNKESYSSDNLFKSEQDILSFIQNIKPVNYNSEELNLQISSLRQVNQNIESENKILISENDKIKKISFECETKLDNLKIENKKLSDKNNIQEAALLKVNKELKTIKNYEIEVISQKETIQELKSNSLELKNSIKVLEIQLATKNILIDTIEKQLIELKFQKEQISSQLKMCHDKAKVFKDDFFNNMKMQKELILQDIKEIEDSLISLNEIYEKLIKDIGFISSYTRKEDWKFNILNIHKKINKIKNI